MGKADKSADVSLDTSKTSKPGEPVVPAVGAPAGTAGAVVYAPVKYDPALTPEENVERSAQSPVEAAPPLRTDGPTLEEFVAAGYEAENYPPTGYAARPSKPEEKGAAAAPAPAKAAPKPRPSLATLLERAHLAAARRGDHPTSATLLELAIATGHYSQVLERLKDKVPDDVAELLVDVREVLKSP